MLSASQEIPRILLLHSQQPATCPYPEPDTDSPRPHIPLLEYPSTPGFIKRSLSCRFPQQHPARTSPLPRTCYKLRPSNQNRKHTMYYYFCFSRFDSPWEPWPPVCGPSNTPNDPPLSAGVLCTGVRPIAKTSICTTHNTHKRHIHAPGGVRTHNPSKRADVVWRLRLCFQWDLLWLLLTFSRLMTYIYIYIYIYIQYI